MADFPLFVQPGAPLPAVRSPFAVLMDADDADWGDEDLLRSAGCALLDAGARYFVCFGSAAERLHDTVDDLIVEGGYAGITTTYHDSESAEDVANFFSAVATAGLKGALVVVRDTSGWASRLAHGT